MFKLLLMLGTFLGVALAVLALRDERLEVTAETVRIHDQILARHQTLLDQRVAIARQTNPWALAAGLKTAGVNTGDAMESRAPASGGAGTPSATPAVEMDLVAPLLDHSGDGAGHSNTNRPRG